MCWRNSGATEACSGRIVGADAEGAVWLREALLRDESTAAFWEVPAESILKRKRRVFFGEV
jgi:hypothetical protein